MPEPFSLARQAWIPVALDNGDQVFVRPCDISQPYEGRRILRIASGRPDCDIALSEFLIGLLAVTMDGLDLRRWPQRFRQPPPCADLEAAFAPLEPALVLDGEGPRFFQDLEPLDGKPTPVAALLIDTAGSATHFVKAGRTDCLSRAGAAIVLLTLQTQAPSGGAGHRTSLRGGGPLTTLVLPGMPNMQEPTLWQRLWANTPDEFQASIDDLPGVFPWLGATRVSDKAGVTTTPEDVHKAQVFFGMPRRIRLIFEPNIDGRPCDLTGLVDDVMVTGYVTRPWGTNYTAWSRGHPLSPYYKVKPGDIELLPLHLKSSRIGYRQYVGLVLDNQGEGKLPADVVHAYRARAENLVGDDHDALPQTRLLVAGYAMDNMKPLDFAEALVPLVVTGTETGDKNVADMGRRLVASAELVAIALTSAVKLALYGPKSEVKGDSTVLEPVRQRFWADTEQDFYAALRQAAEALVPDGTPVKRPGDVKVASGEIWRRTLRCHALRIFDDTVPIEDAAADDIKHIVDGRRNLGLMLDGHSPAGRKLLSELQLPAPANKSKQGASA
jgi:CRISPR system Cascade subunit CasA